MYCASVASTFHNQYPKYEYSNCNRGIYCFPDCPHCYRSAPVKLGCLPPLPCVLLYDHGHVVHPFRSSCLPSGHRTSSDSGPSTQPAHSTPQTARPSSPTCSPPTSPHPSKSPPSALQASHSPTASYAQVRSYSSRARSCYGTSPAWRGRVRGMRGRRRIGTCLTSSFRNPVSFWCMYRHV